MQWPTATHVTSRHRESNASCGRSSPSASDFASGSISPTHRCGSTSSRSRATSPSARSANCSRSPSAYEQTAPLGFLAMLEISSMLFGTSDMSLRLFPFLCGIASRVRLLASGRANAEWKRRAGRSRTLRPLASTDSLHGGAEAVRRRCVGHSPPDADRVESLRSHADGA